MTNEQEITIRDGSMLYDDWRRSTFKGKIYYIWMAISIILIFIPLVILLLSQGKGDLDGVMPCFAVAIGMGVYLDGVINIEILFFARWIDKRNIDYIPYLKKTFSKSKKNSKVLEATYIASHPSKIKKELVIAGIHVIGFVVFTILINFIVLDFVNKNGWPVVKVILASITFLVTNIIPAFLYSSKDSKDILSWREHIIQSQINNESDGKNNDEGSSE